MINITYIMSGISMVLKTGPKKFRTIIEYSKMVIDTVAEFKSFLKFEADAIVVNTYMYVC